MASNILYQSLLSSAFKIISINVEGFSSAKGDILSDLCKDTNCHILCIQETHRGPKRNRPIIKGMKLISERAHNQYGSALYIKENLIYQCCNSQDDNNIEILTVELDNIIISSVYKPPNVPFKLPLFTNVKKSRIVIGDFNSHNSTWGYKDTNEDGHNVEIWAENNHLSLIHDSSQSSSFISGRWKNGYNPDLIFVSNCLKDICRKKVLNHFPNSQHKPIMLEIISHVNPQIIPFRRRFNFKKANWSAFSVDLDNELQKIQPIIENYDLFIEIVRNISRKHIPRGCRTKFIPGLQSDHKILLNNYIKSYNTDPFSQTTMDLGKSIVTQLNEKRQQKWKETLENIDIKYSSRQAWNTIKNLCSDSKQSELNCSISANQVAHQLILNGKSMRLKKNFIRRNKNLESTFLSRPFEMNELDSAIKSLKLGKAAGLDDLKNEQIKRFGIKTKQWLLDFFNNCIFEENIPKIWRKTKIIAIPKPGKSLDNAKNFRPISLLCCLYKLFERMILSRLSPNIDDQLIPQQAGFRPGKSSTGQILNLTQHIEDGFENNLITGAVFVDLS